MAYGQTALGVATPTIDPVGAAQDARSQAINQQGAQMQQEAAAFSQVAQMGLGVMGGKLDGQVDPKAFDQMIGLLGNNPLAQKLKDHPELLPVITRGSLDVLKASNDQQTFDMQKQKLNLEIEQAHNDLLKSKYTEVSPNATLHDVTGATPDYTAPAPAATPTNDQRELVQINSERATAKKPPLSMEDYLASKGGNGTTIIGADGTVIQQGGKAGSAYDVADAQAHAKLGTQIAADGRNGQSQLGTLGKMKDLLSNDQVYTGPLGPQIQQLQRVAKTFGIDSGVEDTESFNALTKAAVLDKMGGSLGTGVSNADRDYIDAQVPNLDNTKAGNLELIDVMSKVAQRQVDIAKVAADYKKAHGGRLDSSFDDELATWAEAHPMFGDAPTADTTAAPAPAASSDTGAPAVPKAGTVEDGYRFKGGDPADQRNWEKVSN